MAKINLNNCVKGDILISQHGKAFLYDHKGASRAFPHIITDAISGAECSRSNNGFAFNLKRLPKDHEIVKVIPQNVDLKLKEQHRNTRHDAIDCVHALFRKYNQREIKGIHDLIEGITRDIQNLKQRKP